MNLLSSLMIFAFLIPTAFAGLTQEEVNAIRALEKCGGNGTYDFEGYDPSTTHFRVVHGTRINRACRESKYSNSLASGATLALEILDENEFCIDREHRSTLDSLIRTPKNVALFASIYFDEGRVESCTRSRITIYREDDIKIDLDFDFTD